jgi:hypothetical protein
MDFYLNDEPPIPPPMGCLILVFGFIILVVSRLL